MKYSDSNETLKDLLDPELGDSSSAKKGGKEGYEWSLASARDSATPPEATTTPSAAQTSARRRKWIWGGVIVAVVVVIGVVVGVAVGVTNSQKSSGEFSFDFLFGGK